MIYIFFIFIFTLLFIYTYVRLHEKLRKRIAPLADPHFKITPEEILFPSTNISLSGWLFKVKNPKALVIVCHGHGDPVGGKADEYKYVEPLLLKNYDLFLFDFRGFGKSEFSLHTLGFNEADDVTAAIEYIKKRKDLHNLPIFMVASSMGAVSTIRALQNRKDIKAAVFIAPFKSISSLFNKQIRSEGFPLYPFLWFLQLNMILMVGRKAFQESSYKAAAYLKIPVLYMLGTEDTVVSRNDSPDLFLRTSSPKDIQVTKGGKHNLLLSDQKETLKTIDIFFEKFL